MVDTPVPIIHCNRGKPVKDETTNQPEITEKYLDSTIHTLLEKAFSGDSMDAAQNVVVCWHPAAPATSLEDFVKYWNAEHGQSTT